MGLDAVVYCDCHETGMLREPPPAGARTVLAEDGSLGYEGDDPDAERAFDQWLQNRACAHADGILVHHRIGNIALVAALREELSKSDFDFPILLTAVLYNGTHCGDSIKYPMLISLRPEVDELSKVHCDEPRMEQYMRGFETAMRELLEAGLRVRKPIAF